MISHWLGAIYAASNSNVDDEENDDDDDDQGDCTLHYQRYFTTDNKLSRL